MHPSPTPLHVVGGVVVVGEGREISVGGRIPLWKVVGTDTTYCTRGAHRRAEDGSLLFATPELWSLAGVVAFGNLQVGDVDRHHLPNARDVWPFV